MTKSIASEVSSDLPTFPWHRSCPFAPPDLYGSLRAERPIAKVNMMAGGTAWVVTRYDHARQLLTDPRASSDRAHPGFPYFIPVPQQFRTTAGFLGMDPPEHTVHRRTLVGEFTARRMELWRPRVQQIVDERVDAILAGPKPADLVQALSLPVPMSVSCELLGVPDVDQHFFHQRAKIMFGRTSSAEERQTAITELMAYFEQLVIDKEKNPGDDLLSRAAAKYREAGTYDRQEMIILARLLLNAGHETSANMISLGVLTLLEHPDQLAELVNDPTIIQGAVEELLRYLSPSDLATSRVALADIEIGDVVIRKGEGVIILGAAANRDPATFENPDALDIHRDAHDHVSFGHGIHRCIGGPLAQVELEVVYATLFRRIPGLRLAVPFDQLSFKDGAIMYGAYELPVTW
jgi:cytochrome P450